MPISVYEWSGIGRQTLLVGWTRLDGPADLRAVAALLRAVPRSETRFPTALGDALAFGAALLAVAPACDRRVIDVSGDGSRNEGPDPRTVHAAPAFDGVEVNALVIGAAARPGLLRYFERFVIRGPDAFAEPADDYRDYPRAIRRKLLRELRPMVFGAVR